GHSNPEPSAFLPRLLGSPSRGALLEGHDARRQTDGGEPPDSRRPPSRRAEGREPHSPACRPAGGTDPTRTKSHSWLSLWRSSSYWSTPRCDSVPHDIYWF